MVSGQDVRMFHMLNGYCYCHQIQASHEVSSSNFYPLQPLGGIQFPLHRSELEVHNVPPRRSKGAHATPRQIQRDADPAQAPRTKDAKKQNKNHQPAMAPKHRRADDERGSPPAAKRARLAAAPRGGADLLSPLSDELLVRILSYLAPSHLAPVVSRVSRRFRRLAEDSQLWKALYYARFVLPRAMRVPGFREGRRGGRPHKLHYKGRRALWADGRLGGLVTERGGEEHPARRLRVAPDEGREEEDRVHWKRQFKIRHNWARGKCAVEELKLGPDPEDEIGEGREDDLDRSKMLVKVVEGLAVTADGVYGLRAWDLKTRDVMAQIDLHDGGGGCDPAPPSCLGIDDRGLERGTLDISVGFVDGSFGVWRLSVQHKSLARRYKHARSSNGELMALSYSHPYLLTATGTVLISLYTFDVPERQEGEVACDESLQDPPTLPAAEEVDSRSQLPTEDPTKHDGGTPLPAPYLLTSLRSHTADPPLALSIRETATTTVASIAYTFSTRHGWSIGIQDLHIAPNTADPRRRAPSITTRLAYTNPVHTTAGPPARQRSPTALCYTHPYLLATLPDNTLVLHLCTSDASALAVSPGIRLWGHTSGISGAEITARGRAVSVSSRGGEMRVWELEGRSAGPGRRRGRSSVEIRAGAEGLDRALVGGNADWEERRNWVGFDDEMVIVLKEARGGRESLLVYDFT